MILIIYPIGRDGFYGWMGFGGSGRAQNTEKLNPKIFLKKKNIFFLILSDWRSIPVAS